MLSPPLSRASVTIHHQLGNDKDGGDQDGVATDVAETQPADTPRPIGPGRAGEGS